MIKLGQKRRVYNLQVFDTHEYFANGVLVSNCVMASSIGYAILQEQGEYIEGTSEKEDFSVMSAMFGEETGGIISH